MCISWHIINDFRSLAHGSSEVWMDRYGQSWMEGSWRVYSPESVCLVEPVKATSSFSSIGSISYNLLFRSINQLVLCGLSFTCNEAKTIQPINNWLDTAWRLFKYKHMLGWIQEPNNHTDDKRERERERSVILLLSMVDQWLRTLSSCICMTGPQVWWSRSHGAAELVTGPPTEPAHSQLLKNSILENFWLISEVAMGNWMRPKLGFIASVPFPLANKRLGTHRHLGHALL